MTCDHKSQTSKFCPDCGTKLEDTSIEKFNKELLPILQKINYWMYEIRATNIIYKYMLENDIKIPKQKIFYDGDNMQFINRDDFIAKCPNFERMNDKLVQTEENMSLLGIPWLCWMPLENPPQFVEIDKLESKYNIPVPSKTYSPQFAEGIVKIHDLLDKSEYKDNRETVKEYLLAVIKKM